MLTARMILTSCDLGPLGEDLGAGRGATGKGQDAACW